MGMNIKTEKVISVQEWDKLVSETYGRPYAFQQQGGCQSRGVFRILVPGEAEDFKQDKIPEVVNGEEMGVSFKAWLARDHKQSLPEDKEQWAIDLWWHRNFYPEIQTVANDLHSRGVLPAGEYTIDINW